MGTKQPPRVWQRAIGYRTQPAPSRIVSRLKRESGARLFEPIPAGVHPTRLDALIVGPAPILDNSTALNLKTSTLGVPSEGQARVDRRRPGPDPPDTRRNPVLRVP